MPENHSSFSTNDKVDEMDAPTASSITSSHDIESLKAETQKHFKHKHLTLNVETELLGSG